MTRRGEMKDHCCGAAAESGGAAATFIVLALPHARDIARLLASVSRQKRAGSSWRLNIFWRHFANVSALRRWPYRGALNFSRRRSGGGNLRQRGNSGRRMRRRIGQNIRKRAATPCAF